MLKISSKTLRRTQTFISPNIVKVIISLTLGLLSIFVYKASVNGF
jgi:hypothetical protein